MRSHRRTHQTPKRLVFFTAAVLALAPGCQPSDEQPGLWLRGEEVTRSVRDWSFTDEIDEIFIETYPWYGFPHSTTIWCVELDGALYIGSYGAEKKSWEKALARDPGARLKIGGRLHAVRVEAVIDPALARTIHDRYRNKYDMEEVFGEHVPDWWFYKIEQPEDSRRSESTRQR